MGKQLWPKGGTGQKESVGDLPSVLRGTISTSMAAAAAIGQYVDNVAVGSNVTAMGSLIFGSTLPANHKLKLSAMMCATAGAVDPTTAVALSLFECALTPGASGFTHAISNEIAESSAGPHVVTPRGSPALVESNAFTLDNSKLYVIITTLSVANMPASCILRTFTSLHTLS